MVCIPIYIVISMNNAPWRFTPQPHLILHKQFAAALALALFVLWVLTDYSDASLSLDDFAFLANRFYR